MRHYTFIIAVLLSVSVASAATLDITANDIGSVVSVPVYIDQTTQLAGYDIDIVYDAQRLTYAGATPGSFLGVDAFTFFSLATDTPGRIDNLVGILPHSQSVSGSGTLFTLTFVLIQAGTATINIEEAVFSNTLAQPLINQNVQLLVDATEQPAETVSTPRRPGGGGETIRTQVPNTIEDGQPRIQISFSLIPAQLQEKEQQEKQILANSAPQISITGYATKAPIDAQAYQYSSLIFFALVAICLVTAALLLQRAHRPRYYR